MEIKGLLQETINKGASDLHITANSPPVLRISGELTTLSDYPVLDGEEAKKLIYSVLSDRQRVVFEENRELDFSLSMPGISRFRVNVHKQRGNVEAAFRIVSLQIPTLKELHLPEVVRTLANKSNGMVIVTGPTGMGKTTTLAAMVEMINTERKCLIISIEDPIEYMHKNEKGIIKQREVGVDTLSFANGLKYVLRQDPDVISIGEMRDLETISTALTAAETGHLVLTTLHTPDAAQTIDRIIDVFPPHQQQQIKVQLASCLQGIIAQQLLPRTDGQGRIVACEILVCTSGIRNLIREHKTQQIPTLLQTGSQDGMLTMDKALKELYQKGMITYEVALSKVKNPSEFQNL